MSACTTAVDDAEYGVAEQKAVLSGAIFTTTVNGSRVNANLYDAKADVYLDGGPGPNAPASAAALPAGDYYFQVTNPNGRVLLSSDAIACRKIHVNTDGVIDLIYPGPGGCEHASGIDQDHPELGAITVQLIPYDDTPNPGGEYKVWITPTAKYNPAVIRTHGFVPSSSKTDNFKVKETTPTSPVCGDGKLDPGEQCDDGNMVSGDGCSATCTKEAAPCCGDGKVDAGEQCDDGNTISGDGCSAACTRECVTGTNFCPEPFVLARSEF